MTATLIAGLVEEGKLHWDDTLGKAFPGLAKSMTPRLRDVTLAQLLTHHAGLRANAAGGLSAIFRRGTTRDQRQNVLESIAGEELAYPPGEELHYSNLGYILAGHMAEQAADAPWERLITERVFRPLGMKSAGFGPMGTREKLDQPWQHSESGKPIGPGMFSDNPPMLGPAGTVHCSLPDWARFIADQLRGARGGRALLKPATYRKLHSSPYRDVFYTLGGWGGHQKDERAGLVLEHDGSNRISYASAWIAPERDLAVLVATNQGGEEAAKACHEVRDLLIRKYLPAEKLRNAGFESQREGWSTHVYGANPEISADAAVVHEGKQSLRISAAQPSDTALGQEVLLWPGRCYRLSGWVRTRGLDPHGAPVFGTFQVQHPGGQGTIAAGANHGGDTDWTEVPVYFVAPPGGRVRVCVFFVGFGKGTGTAWFDDLRLDEVDLSRTPLKVTREPVCPGTISPMQYGQFIEYLCDLVPGMWAEKLYDGSFEGLSPYNFEYLKETDFREKPWYPCGATNRADYVRDRTDPVSGAVSQKIAVTGGAPCTVGIAQDGIAVDRGEPCLFHCYLRQQGLSGPVQVRLSRGGETLASCELRVTGKWKKYSARLVPKAADTAATLSITFRGPGTLWLDSASLMPENTVGGWRRDVVEAVRALKPGVIRFGGSTLDDPAYADFEWRDTIGDPDRRKPFRAWGGLQPTGPGLEEIVQFCRHVGAEPLLCVRVTGRTPKDAAEQVQYFNGSADTPMGKLRARNGHAEPYRIRYWQIGNERSGRDYEERLRAFCKAMKEADPSIKVLSSYPTPGVLRAAGDLLDYVSPHHYDIASLAATEHNLTVTRALLRAHAPGRPIKVAVTEWNTTAGDRGPKRAGLWSLANALACSRYHNLLHRQCDLVEIANRSNLTNSFCSGIIQTDNHRLYKTPTYHAQRLYATLAGDRPLKVESAVPAAVAPDVSATLSPGGDVVTLFAVNASTEDVTRPLDLSAFGAGGREVSVWTLADRDGAGEPDVANSFADPERVRPVRSTFRAPAARFEHRFPALSLTVLRWRVMPERQGR